MLRVLRQRHLLILWVALVFSSIGDRLYEIAVVWLAIQLTGSEAGFVLATQAASRLIFGLVGGVYADRLNRRKLMMTTDVTRALAVFSVPLAAVFGDINLWHLALVAGIVGGLDAFFEPALIASLPHLTRTPQELNAFNGLVDVTSRLAMIVGPGLAGVLLAVMPMSQFFTLDAISFGLSSTALFVIGRGFTWQANNDRTTQSASKFVSDLQDAWQVLRTRPHVLWCILAGGVTNIVWGAVFVVGLALMIETRAQGNAGTYGLVLASYGVSNVLSNLIVSNMALRHKPRLVFAGKAIFGIGLLAMSLSQISPIAMVPAAISFAAVAAIGGPMMDLSLLLMIQGEFPAHTTGKVFSTRVMISSTGYSLGLALAAPLYNLFPLTLAMASLCCMLILMSILGMLIFWWHTSAQPVQAEAAIL